MSAFKFNPQAVAFQPAGSQMQTSICTEPLAATDNDVEELDFDELFIQQPDPPSSFAQAPLHASAHTTGKPPPSLADPAPNSSPSTSPDSILPNGSPQHSSQMPESKPPTSHSPQTQALNVLNSGQTPPGVAPTEARAIPVSSLGKSPVGVRAQGWILPPRPPQQTNSVAAGSSPLVREASPYEPCNSGEGLNLSRPGTEDSAEGSVKGDGSECGSIKSCKSIDSDNAKLGPEHFEVLCLVGKGSYGKVFQVRKRDDGLIFAMKVMRKEAIIGRNENVYLTALEQHKTLNTQAHVPPSSEGAPSGEGCRSSSNGEASTAGAAAAPVVSGQSPPTPWTAGARPSALRHTFSERDILTSIRHPFIVNLHFAFTTPSKIYMVFDFVNGGHLFFQLYKQGYFSEDVARFYTAELVLALAHLHQLDIIHRDLKPENVLLDLDGHVRLTDFGLAKEGVKSDHQGARSFCGTAEYMPPEMIVGEGEHGKAADWWAIGILLYEMLLGKTPFQAKNRQLQNKNILTKKVRLPSFLSAGCHQLIRGLLTKEQTERLGTGGGPQDIQDQPFFKPINWNKLINKELPSPFRPEVSGDWDITNFDTAWTDQDPLDSPVGSPRGPLSEFPEDPFAGYSFTSPSWLESVANNSECSSEDTPSRLPRIESCGDCELLHQH